MRAWFFLEFSSILIIFANTMIIKTKTINIIRYENKIYMYCGCPADDGARSLGAGCHID
jgi:hypothetical protein